MHCFADHTVLKIYLANLQSLKGKYASIRYAFLTPLTPFMDKFS